MNRPRKRDRHLPLPKRIYLRHGTFYYVSRDGRWHALGRDLHDALIQHARIVAQPKDSMADLIDRMMPLVLEPVRASTAQHYRSAAQRLKDALIEFRPAQVTHGTVTQLLDAYARQPAVANRLLVVLRRVFDLALERELVTVNPCHRVKRRKQPKRDRLIAASEYRAIKKFASPRLAAIMDVAVLTGQRIGDVLAIRRADMGEDGIAFVQAKTGKRLIVEWTPELRTVVDGALALQGKVHYALLFPAHGGGMLKHQNVWRDYKAAALKAGVSDVTLHDLRALAATMAQAQGLNATDLLGHTDARTTASYLRDRTAKRVRGPGGVA